MVHDGQVAVEVRHGKAVDHGERHPGGAREPGCGLAGPHLSHGYLPTVGMALRSLGRIAGGPDQLGVAVSGTRTARGGKAVSERGGPDAGAGRRLDPETVSGAESWNVPTICWRWSSMATRS